MQRQRDRMSRFDGYAGIVHHWRGSRVKSGRDF
jgi:hypothetical protein